MNTHVPDAELLDLGRHRQRKAFECELGRSVGRRSVLEEGKLQGANGCLVGLRPKVPDRVRTAEGKRDQVIKLILTRILRGQKKLGDRG
jgi:hypothetical protein